jgi:hypothetical protein
MKAEFYTRWCRCCGLLFKTKMRYSRVCDSCTRMNREIFTARMKKTCWVKRK